MLGALAGDIIGSVYEWNNIKTTSFPLFSPACFFTDDTVLTVALADAILSATPYATKLREYYARYPHAGYGARFAAWAAAPASGPYYSWGNGAAMRISPVGHAFDTLEEVLAQARAFTAVTHDHPEGIRGAQATAAAIFLGRAGRSAAEVREYVSGTFGYDLNRTCDQIRPTYVFDESCQGTVPQALTACLEGHGYEDAIRLAVSLGGDTDTLACIAGGVAEALYGLPQAIADAALATLDDDLRAVTASFVTRYGA